MTDAPIFIVGVQRSGTTLLAASLAAHSQLSCGPETHFFRRLNEIDKDMVLAANAWPNRAVDFICSIGHTGFDGHEGSLLIEKYDLRPEDIIAYLANKSPTVHNMLASVAEPHMTRAGKQRWIEKTPDHLTHLSLIRQYFPQSPIVRIIRDPRDVALSLMRVPWGADSFFNALLFWQRADQASQNFFKKDDKSLTLRFEDLLANPEDTLRRLCQFIGVLFEEAMLDTSQTGKLVNSQRVPWKTKASQPMDLSRIAGWRQGIDKRTNQLAEAFLGDRLLEYGYPQEEVFPSLGDLFPSPALAFKYEAELKAVAAHGVRFWKRAADELPAAKVFLGDPAANHWLGQDSKVSKVRNTFLISAEIMKVNRTKNTLYWIPDNNNGNEFSYLSFLLKKLLGSHKVSAITT